MSLCNVMVLRCLSKGIICFGVPLRKSSMLHDYLNSILLKTGEFSFFFLCLMMQSFCHFILCTSWWGYSVCSREREERDDIYQFQIIFKCPVLTCNEILRHFLFFSLVSTEGWSIWDVRCWTCQYFMPSEEVLIGLRQDVIQERDEMSFLCMFCLW